MQINSSNNLPIITGYEPQRQRRQQRQPEQVEQERVATNNQIVAAQFPPASTTTQRVRPTVNAQPLYNQQLTQSGEQAQRAYHDVAMAGEVELAHRLDVIV